VNRIYFIILLSFFYTTVTVGQTCIADYYAIDYKAAENIGTTKTIRNTAGELLMIGSVQQPNGVFATAGLVSKLTAQGSVIWTKKFSAAGYASLTFTDGVALVDGSFILVGWAQADDPVTHQIGKNWGVVFKIDGYGNLLFTKSFSNYNETAYFSYLSNIEATSDGNFILFGYLYTRPQPGVIGRGPQVILKMDSDGLIKWKVVLSSSNGARVGTRGTLGFKQTANGDVLLGLRFEHSELSGFGYGPLHAEGIYLVRIDYATGKLIWHKVFTAASVKNLTATSPGFVQHITELPGGDLSFSISFSDSTGYTAPPYTKRSANFITTGTGSLKKVWGYYNNTFGCFTKDVVDVGVNGEQVFLMDDGTRPLLMQVNANGQIAWQRAYGNTSAKYAPVNLIKATQGFYIMSNDRNNQGIINLSKTDTDGIMDCFQSPVNMISEDVSTLYKSYDSLVDYNVGEDNLGGIPGYGQAYKLSGTTVCFKACCKDTVDVANTKQVTLCKGQTFTLPNNKIVKDSGTYYISYKTAKGCDSIAFFHVEVLDDPKDLSITGDLCFDGKDSIVLTATAGFNNYLWMNTASTSNIYLANKPGIYTVSVTNQCGTKQAKIELFASCEFTGFMPNAFTPNGDGLNDVFRIPAGNQNKLIRFLIYNRWGKAIFQTTDKAKGWDGAYYGIKQPMGVYIYMIEMETANGKTVRSKGTVTLVR
jgi:gliding motility-associated-like protein